MAREYFNAYHSYLKSVEPLNDAERGRLFTALLTYSSTGAEPELHGNERFVFPTMRQQIDRDVEQYERKCSINRANGALGCKANGGERYRTPPERPPNAPQDKGEGEGKGKDKEEDKGKGKYTLGVAPETPGASPPIISLPLNDGSAFEIFQSDIDMWSNLYPAVDVMQQLRNMAGWIDGNPSKRKTRSGIKRFVNGWLAKEQNKGGDRATNAKSGFAYNADFEEGTSL